MLGDHQPSTIVSGFGGNRDVPVTVIARDPQVVRRISGWGWQAGLRPDDTGAGVADGRLPRPLPHGLQQPGAGRHRVGVGPGRARAR